MLWVCSVKIGTRLSALFGISVVIVQISICPGLTMRDSIFEFLVPDFEECLSAMGNQAVTRSTWCQTTESRYKSLLQDEARRVFDDAKRNRYKPYRRGHMVFLLAVCLT